jgi:hypothetical protein
MPLAAFILNLVILCVVLGILYIIVQAILGYLAVPWSGLALKIIGLLCLLAVCLYILEALVGAGPPLFRLR